MQNIRIAIKRYQRCRAIDRVLAYKEKQFLEDKISASEYAIFLKKINKAIDANKGVA